MKEDRSKHLRRRVAREAAILLYTSQEKEYKQAKGKAAQRLGTRILPSNLEVAEEVDKIADEIEGPPRRERLLQMRTEALQIMKAMKDFSPKLVGSVWRGTSHRTSDIDIGAFSFDPEKVLTRLQENNFKVEGTEWRPVTKGGRAESSFHIYLNLPSSNEVEIVVRGPEKRHLLKRCETYGDPVTGLNLPQLRRVLEKSPLKKFTPKRGS